MAKIVKPLKLSVCVITYNQEKYIRQCLQSILEQQTDFDFEVVVGDDCSTDSTQAILKEYVERHPEKIRLVLQETNTRGSKNYIDTHNAAIGEYIVHVDGDDYALPGKLTALCRTLDEKPEVNIAWHRLKFLDERTGTFTDDLIDVKLQPAGGFTRGDLLACGVVGSNSAGIYRRHLRRYLDPTVREMMDYYLTVECIADGKAVWIDGIYGVNRRNLKISRKAGNKRNIFFNSHLQYFLRKYPKFKTEINSLAFLFLLADIKNLRNTSAFKLWLQSFSPFFPIIFLKYLKLYKILRRPK